MSKRNRVIVNIFLGKGLGGIEKSFADYAGYFKQLGYVSKAIISKDAKIGKFLPDAVELKELSNFAEWDLIASYRLKRLLKKMGADLVVIHGRRAAKLCRYVHNIPKVGVAHNYSLRYLLPLDYVFAITADLKNRLCAMGYKKERIFDMPHMIEVPARKQPQPKGSKLVLGAMGRFVPEKGFDLLLKSLKILKDRKHKFKLLLAGDGHEKQLILNMVSDLDLTKEVEFVGWIGDLNSFYKKINIFCLSSRKESFGLVLLEAFAHAKAVVSFKTGGASHIGEDGKDILFAECGDSKDFADKLEMFFKDPKLIDALSDLSFKKVSSYYNKVNNLKKLGDSLSKVFKDD